MRRRFSRFAIFVDYGDTFERILKQSDLRSWYRPGSYQFLMGIYQIEKTYPRRFAREFKHFSENIRLHVTEDESSFELIKREGEASAQNLWYKDPEQGWIQAEERMENPRIPSGAFKFFNPMSGSDHRGSRADCVYEKR